MDLVSCFTIKVNGIMEHRKDYIYFGGKLTQIQKMKCRECGGQCKKSKAMLNPLVDSRGMPGKYCPRGTTMSRIGKAQFVDCMKCEQCGHSFIN